MVDKIWGFYIKYDDHVKKLIR